MPLFMDIHRNMQVSLEEVVEAHNADLAVQSDFDVHYLRWWFNQDLGSIYCLVDAPSADVAVQVHRHATGLVPDDIIPIEQGFADAILGGDEGGSAVREDPPGTVNADNAFRTIVFTDLLDSTPLAQRLGDDAYVELLKKHDALMHGCLERHRGSHVKSTGDGLMASFSSVALAVQCMIDMQRALAEHNVSRPEEELRVRMGAAAGEPVSHGEDLFGTAVNLAARLSGHAEPGQIMVAGVVRDLCIGKTFAFNDHGEVTLKGFGEPVRVYEVQWQS